MSIPVNNPVGPNYGEKSVIPVRQQTAYQVHPIKLKVPDRKYFAVHRLEIAGEFSGSTRPGKITFFGRSPHVSHWGDGVNEDGTAHTPESIEREVQISGRFEEDVLGFMRLGMLIHLPGLPHGWTLFLNGPPRHGTGILYPDSPFRLSIFVDDGKRAIQVLTMEPIVRALACESDRRRPGRGRTGTGLRSQVGPNRPDCSKRGGRSDLTWRRPAVVKRAKRSTQV